MKSNSISWANIKYFGNELEYAKEALDSRWISGGDFVSKFEKEVESVYRGKAFAVSNGTAALQLALQALSVTPGDRVIVPSFCFQAAGNVLLQLGAVPVYCDVELSSWNQSLGNIQKVYDKSIKGVLLVHNYGGCHDIEKISKWCKEKSLWLLEDCAEAWFSMCSGKLLGQFSDIATFSMHAAKTITCGEGGLLISYREDLNERITQLRSHGLVGAPRPYMNQLAGNNYRLSNIHSAIALGQLEKRTDILEYQIARQKKYTSMLGELKFGQLQHCIGDGIQLWAIGFQLFPHMLTISRDDIMDLMQVSGIATRPGFYSTDKLNYLNDESSYKNSKCLSDDIIVFPCGSDLTMTEIERTCQIFIEIVKNNTKYSVMEPSSSEYMSLLGELVENVRSTDESFRYFDSRELSIVADHDANFLFNLHGKAVAYGHLESEGADTWLGVCVHSGYRNQSFGSTMLKLLLATAVRQNISVVSLTVDINNPSAIRLYESFGFVVIKEDDTFYKMQKVF
ncbi:GNAT family N-acetyltransferase [Brumicola blandensis]|uniref:GNAT family N-acetyltransferase n=1 Tax=Brumicola blandensis TaxID=3075611 RepID=A0AAW8R4C0_9ALTE|nr:GNAT family N-acetyltransferase [Alteromonas sp. W409]MDT0582690.1 GNAT family N-acetyltransferase [Alteromonas sp. W409]